MSETAQLPRFFARGLSKLTKEPREKKKELLNNLKLLVSIIPDGSRKIRFGEQENLHDIKEMMKITL